MNVQFLWWKLDNVLIHSDWDERDSDRCNSYGNSSLWRMKKKWIEIYVFGYWNTRKWLKNVEFLSLLQTFYKISKSLRSLAVTLLHAFDAFLNCCSANYVIYYVLRLCPMEKNVLVAMKYLNRKRMEESSEEREKLSTKLNHKTIDIFHPCSFYRSILFPKCISGLISVYVYVREFLKTFYSAENTEEERK